MKHMYKFLFNVIALVILGIQLVNGQSNTYTQKVFMPSPSASEIIKYGNYPVSLSSGLPQIGIPLLTANSGKLALDVSLSYHSSGTKIKEKASVVGLGWSLNAGGAVTRVVHGLADEKRGFNWANQATMKTFTDELDTAVPDIYNGDLIPPISPPLWVSPWEPWCTACNWAIQGYEDWQPDEFSFSAGNISGSFIFDQNMKPLLIDGTEPYEIIFNSNFSEIIITDKSGNKYYFGGSEEYLEGTGINATGIADFSYISGWQLKKIESFDTKDVIEFFYESFGGYENDLNVSMSVLIFDYASTNPLSQTREPFTLLPTAWSPFGRTYQSKRVSKITFDGANIQFVYASRSDNDTYNSEARRLSNIKLYRGQTQTDLIKHIELLPSYTAISSYPISGTRCSSYTKNYQSRLLLDKLRIYGSGSSSPVGEVYSFSYNTTPIPSYESSAQDHWGYYNGKLNNDCPGGDLGLIPRYNYFPNVTNSPGILGYGDRSVATAFAKAGVLEKITYPTGGYSTFEYESNKVIFTGDLLGGLRISQITSTTSASDPNLL